MEKTSVQDLRKYNGDSTDNTGNVSIKTSQITVVNKSLYQRKVPDSSKKQPFCVTFFMFNSNY